MCPFCTGMPSLVVTRWSGNGEIKGYRIKCTACTATTGMRNTADRAWELWNRRDNRALELRHEEIVGALRWLH